MACSPASVEHDVQERKKLEVMVCGREWRASMTQSGTVYVGTHWVFRLSGIWASFLCWSILLSGCLGEKSDTHSLDPQQEGHRTMTSTVYNQSNEPTQDSESSANDPRKQMTMSHPRGSTSRFSWWWWLCKTKTQGKQPPNQAAPGKDLNEVLAA